MVHMHATRPIEIGPDCQIYIAYGRYRPHRRIRACSVVGFYMGHFRNRVPMRLNWLNLWKVESNVVAERMVLPPAIERVKACALQKRMQRET